MKQIATGQTHYGMNLMIQYISVYTIKEVFKMIKV